MYVKRVIEQSLHIYQSMYLYVCENGLGIVCYIQPVKTRTRWAFKKFTASELFYFNLFFYFFSDCVRSDSTKASTRKGANEQIKRSPTVSRHLPSGCTYGALKCHRVFRRVFTNRYTLISRPLIPWVTLYSIHFTHRWLLSRCDRIFFVSNKSKMLEWKSCLFLFICIYSLIFLSFTIHQIYYIILYKFIIRNDSFTDIEKLL